LPHLPKAIQADQTIEKTTDPFPDIADSLVITAFCNALNQGAVSPVPVPDSASTSVFVTEI
jgi:hypothetical protein